MFFIFSIISASDHKSFPHFGFRRPLFVNCNIRSRSFQPVPVRTIHRILYIAENASGLILVVDSLRRRSLSNLNRLKNWWQKTTFPPSRFGFWREDNRRTVIAEPSDLVRRCRLSYDFQQPIFLSIFCGLRRQQQSFKG